MNGFNNLRFHLTIVGVFAAAMLAIVVFMTMNASAVIIGDAYSGSGDWDINNPTRVIDETIYVTDGDINVDANVQIWNSTIYFDWWTAFDIYELTISPGVSFQSNDSTFEGWGYYFSIDNQGTMNTDNVDFNYLMYPTIDGTAVFNDTHFYVVVYGLNMIGTISYSNGTISNINHGFNVTNKAIFYRTMITYVYDGVRLTGAVDLEGSQFRYIYGSLNMTGTHKVNNTNIYRSYDGLYITGSADFTWSNIEYVYTMFSISGPTSFANCSIRYIYDGFNITSKVSMIDIYTYRIYDWFLMGTVSIIDSALDYTYLFNATGTVTVYNTSHYRLYNGMLLSGDVSIELCTYRYTYVGITVTSDNVVVKDTRFDYMYDSGFHFIDSDATLDNVTIDVFSGTNRGYWTTDQQGSYNNRFTMAMGLGIWVEGGNPSFTDVDVEADAYGEFHLDYTGSEQDVRVYTRVLVAAVLIDSTEVLDVSSLTVHDSYMYIRAYFTATNPGMNPLYFNAEMDGRAAGIGLVNYSNMTLTDVVSYNNNRGSIYGPYMSGGFYGGSGYRSYGPTYQVGSAIYGDFASSPSPILTVIDLEIDDGSNWFGHMYLPNYAGTGTPQFGDTVLFDNVTVNYAYNLVFRFEISTAYPGKRALITDVQFTNCYFADIYSRIVEYYLYPGEGTDPTTKTVDIMETFTFDNNTITESFYRYGYLSVGSGGNNMPNDYWDHVVTLADNEFVDTYGRLFEAWAHWDFVKGNDEFYLVNNNFDNCTDGSGSTNPFYIDSFDTIRFLGNTFTDMDYAYTGDIYDSGGSNSGVKPDDWLFMDNTWDNCTNRQWSEIIFMEFGGDVVFTNNEVMNQNGLISIMTWLEYAGTGSLDITDNEYHNNMAYFVEYGNPNQYSKGFVMTIKDNNVYENEDYFLNFWGSSSTLNNFDYDATIIIEDNTFTDNTGGIINIWGDVSVKDNTFTNNMGPLVHIEYINLNVPDVSGNVMANNEDLFIFEAKDRGYQLVAMDLSQQTLTCTGTALHVTNIDMTLDMVDIVGADTAILAWNSFVNAFSSNIDGDTCEVVADGLITTWRPVEVYVSWGDKDGMDSGTPVSEALIVFNTASGDYYSSAYAGNDGMLAQSDYQEWSVDLGGVYWYSAYNMKVAAAGTTNDTFVVLDKDLIGNDMVHLVLWDVFPPVVAITEPFSGAIFAKDTVDTFGFVAEVGSGLETVEYSDDGGDTWIVLPTSGLGDWTLALSGLMDGDVTLMVRATDVAGNTAQTSVTITIDTTPPALSIIGLPDITNMADVTISGTVEVGSEIFLNGMSHGIATGSALAIDYTLHEGVNVIVIEAMDMAGNIAVETLTVELDTYEPVLVITGPATGMVTNADNAMVTGVVEVGATLTVGGTQVVPDETGMFSFDYNLASGENTIEVKATDDATNENMVTIVIYQDQNPPNLEIQEPDNDHVTMDSLIQVHIVTDDDAMLWLNGRLLSVTGDVTMSILLVEGENTITAKAMDPAGNEATETVTIIRDTEPPSLVVTVPGVMEIWTNAAELQIEGKALKATGVSVNGVNANYDMDTGIFTVSAPLSVGENNLTVRATDGVNVVTTSIKVWVVRTAPFLNVDALEPVIKTPSVTITGNTAVGIDFITVEHSGISQEFSTEFDGTFAVTLSLADGTYDVTVSATDEYGNSADQSTGSFTVKAKKLDNGGGGDDDGFAVEPLHIGLILAVIGIALIVAAYASAHYITKRRREELEESD